MTGPRIGYAHRVLAVGQTRSGKSELVRYLFARFRVQRVLVDPKHEWQVAGAPAAVMRGRDRPAAEAEAAAIDWRAPIVHVVPEWTNRHQLAALYDAVDAIPRPLVVWTDEAYGVSDASWAPPGLTALQVAGAGRGHGHLAATQRPRNVARVLVTESDHLFLFPPIHGDDLAELTRAVGFLDLGDLTRDLAALPRHGFLWVDRRAQEVTVGDPLPPAYRQWGTAAIAKRPGRDQE